MKIAIYAKDALKRVNPRTVGMLDALAQAGHETYDIEAGEDIVPGTDLLLGIGGDGTFLSASKRVGDSGIPVLGVNLGRLGFLSENEPESIAKTLLSGEYEIEDRRLLRAETSAELEIWPYALNEISVHRIGAAVLEIKVKVDGNALPTYWADGLLVATSSGSTAYSLSVGGPICMPDAKVLLICPVAPHNLNVRPLVVDENSVVEISVQSRDGSASLSVDNRNTTIASGSTLTVRLAQFSLKRVRLSRSNFVKALTSKLFWGEDIRNSGGEEL